MELQWLENGWDSLGMLYGVCWNWFQAKRTSGFCFGSESAEPALFLQELVILCLRVFERLRSRVLDLVYYVKRV